MSQHSTEYDNWNEILKASETSGWFQKIHNIIRPDSITLLSVTEEQKSYVKEFDRDDFVHLKHIENIHTVNIKDFQILKTVFEVYGKFINELMNDLFLSTTIPLKL